MTSSKYFITKRNISICRNLIVTRYVRVHNSSSTNYCNVYLALPHRKRTCLHDIECVWRIEEARKQRHEKRIWNSSDLIWLCGRMRWIERVDLHWIIELMVGEQWWKILKPVSSKEWITCFSTVNIRVWSKDKRVL